MIYFKSIEDQSYKRKFLLFVFLVSFSCSEKQRRSEEEGISNANLPIKIDLDSEMLKEVDFAEIFQLQEVVELEFRDDLYAADLFRVIIAEDCIYALDIDLGSLIRYSLKGKALNRIGKLGDGPEELPQITDFAYDSNADELILASGGAMRISRFKPNGEFVSSLRLRDQMDQVVAMQDKVVLSLTYFNSLFSNLAILDHLGDTVRTFFPFSRDVFPISLKYISGHLTRNQKGQILVNESASSIVYGINEELELSPKYQFQASGDFWPEDERHQLNAYFEKLSTGDLTFLSRYYEESNSKFFFNLNVKKRGARRFVVDPRIGYYDKASETGYLSESEDFLMDLKGPVAAKDDSFYAYMSKNALVELLEKSDEFKKVFLGFSEFSPTRIGDLDTPVLLKFKVR